MKKRILLCGEASFLSTGFATYGLEVMRRLHETGKYELAELANYGSPHDERAAELPWKYYPAMPDEHNKQQVEEYNSKVTNQFGEWKFEEVCCDFKPDIVWSFLDTWMAAHLETSPFRPYYHFAYMPTVDAVPQDEAWMAMFASADKIFTYSDWALEVLKNQSRGRLKTACSAPPGADFKTMTPVQNKRGHKAQMGLPDDALVVGTVMRNQERKLYPDLMASFARFLSEAPPELAKRTYLYLHVSYPDMGWDIPRLIKEFGIGSKTVLTYHCFNCGVSFPNFYADAKAFCRGCRSYNARLPNSKVGVPRNVLASVLNFMDVYVQYSSNEGFGMPMVEAASCGVPIMAVDYSAMSDVVRKLKGIPVGVLALSRESRTGCYRAIPNNDDFIKKLIDFLSLPESVRMKKGFEARKGVEKYYTYERTARIWESHFDEVELKDRSQTWEGVATPHNPPPSMPQGLTDEQFIRWGLINIAGRQDLINSYFALRLTRDLNWGTTSGNVPKSVFNEMALLGTQYGPTEFNRELAGKELMRMCQHRNYWEERRANASKHM